MAEEVRMATEIATASIRCVDNVLQALLKMLEERGGAEQDKKALKNFLGYVEKGGTLMTVPVSQEVAERFEEKLQKTDILTCRTQLRTSPGIYQYIYKAEDQRFMDLLIEEMKKDGHQLIESFNLEIKDLMQHADGHGVVEKIYQSAKEASLVRVELDVHKIPYTCIETEDGTSITLAKDDFKNLVPKIPQLKNLNFKDPLEKKKLNEVVKEIRTEQEQKQKAKEQTKEKGRGGRA